MAELRRQRPLGCLGSVGLLLFACIVMLMVSRFLERETSTYLQAVVTGPVRITYFANASEDWRYPISGDIRVDSSSPGTRTLRQSGYHCPTTVHLTVEQDSLIRIVVEEWTQSDSGGGKFSDHDEPERRNQTAFAVDAPAGAVIEFLLWKGTEFSDVQPRIDFDADGTFDSDLPSE